MSWEQLQAILAEAKAEEERTRREVPVACPICGEILEVNDRGERNCDAGHYRWP